MAVLGSTGSSAYLSNFAAEDGSGRLLELVVMAR